MAKPAPPPSEPSQTVHIGRKGPDSIEFEHADIAYPLRPGEEASLELKLVNHGDPAHVRLSCSPSLKEAVILQNDSPYVKGEESVPVILRRPKDARAPPRGEIAVMSGYGAQRASFGVILGDPREARGAREPSSGSETSPAPPLPAVAAKVPSALARDWRLWSVAALGTSLGTAALFASLGAVVESFASAWLAGALMVVLLAKSLG